MSVGKKKVVIVAMALMIAAVLVVVLWPGGKEPEYQGRKLSEWLYQSVFAGTGPADYEESINAVRHIGTNGLPWLVRWIRHTETPSRRKMWDRLPPIAVRVLGQERVTRYRYPEHLAQMGFSILGQEARPAIPELVQMIEKNAETNRMIFGALGAMGRDAFLPLIAIATNKTLPAGSRSAALYQIGVLHHQLIPNRTATRVLLEALCEPEVRDTAESALNGLVDLDSPFGVGSETYVSALIPCLESSNIVTQTFAANRLGRFGRGAESAVPALLRTWEQCELDGKPAAKNPSEISVLKLREAVSNALEQIAPEMLTNGVAH